MRIPYRVSLHQPHLSTITFNRHYSSANEQGHGQSQGQGQGQSHGHGRDQQHKSSSSSSSRWNKKWIVSLSVGTTACVVATGLAVAHEQMMLEPWLLKQLSLDHAQFRYTWQNNILLWLLKRTITQYTRIDESHHIPIGQLVDTLVALVYFTPDVKSREIIIDILDHLSRNSMLERSTINEQLVQCLMQMCNDNAELTVPVAQVISNLLKGRDTRIRTLIIKSIGFKQLSDILPHSDILFKHEVSHYLSHLHVDYQTELNEGLFEMIESMLEDDTSSNALPTVDQLVVTNISSFLANLSIYTISSKIQCNIANAIVNLSNDGE
ncbi:hypothetical protein SAMD00019534_109020 [Acytostelium subglobosum LB1]|uniref:hypothetical protein n=1 Tax=Acytostelium subglobosum LB1 TaxID=1410327 RepID=UPI0006450A4D|nr:hypothetical protein SAMD00019534_109020 [Acytostelium subglobosum LB1]GAM27726.1 hypothetical protein SAMD00019534_109020 [Acytostelium subglobosum LB1]|eukprot:XP_012749385.1 hypothetical protein SAMD00019534_109020 [Acytostelium subglobosum LB1]